MRGYKSAHEHERVLSPHLVLFGCRDFGDVRPVEVVQSIHILHHLGSVLEG